MALRVAPLLVLSLAIAGTTACADEALSICDLPKDPGKFNGQPIHAKALFSTDMKHFSGLTDSKCPGLYLDASFADISQQHLSVVEFNHTLISIQLDIHDEGGYLFDIEFDGIFRWSEHPRPSASILGSDPSKGSVEVTRIRSFKRQQLHD